MPLTSPDNINYPASTYTSGFVAAIAALATSIQTALSLRGRHSYQWANAAARTAQAGMAAGDTGLQSDTLILYRYSGSAWVAWASDWITYTSTLTNFTVGTGGSQDIRYRYVGGDVQVRGRIVIGVTGTAGTMSGNPLSMTTPVAMSSTFYPEQYAKLGDGDIYQNAARRPATVSQSASSTTVVQIDVYNAAGTLLDTATITAGAPFTIATNPIVLAFYFTYHP